jgi:hypothetical protein
VCDIFFLSAFPPDYECGCPTISTKVKLYASLDKTLDEHGAMLEERDKVLVGARASLAKEGANVLGGVSHY